MPSARFLSTGESVYFSSIDATLTAHKPFYYLGVEGKASEGSAGRAAVLKAFYHQDFSYTLTRSGATGVGHADRLPNNYSAWILSSGGGDGQTLCPEFYQLTGYYSDFDWDAVISGTLASHYGNITGITLNETALSLYPGETFQFVATVEGDGHFDTAVLYSLMTIDPNSITEVGQSSGLLYIDPNETKSTIQIFVQAVGNPDVYAIATVTIIDPKDPDDPDGPGGEGGGDDGGETPDPVPDIKPVYRRVSGQWVKLTAYQRMDGEWVLISTAGD